jgi:hypothetical protein
METGTRDYVFARVHWAARVIHRFSTWGATAGLIAGTIALVVVLPVLVGWESWWPLVALGLAVVLVAAPLRVMWHGRRIRDGFGDARHMMTLLEGFPVAMGDIAVALEGLDGGDARGPRRVLVAWRSMRTIRRVVEDSPARESLDAMVEPLRPQAIALTTFSLWVTLATLVAAIPVALLILLAAVVT